MEAVIATLDTLWFACPALFVFLVFIIRFVSGRTFRQIASELFDNSDQATLVAEGYEIDDELECSRQIDEYFTELDQSRQDWIARTNNQAGEIFAAYDSARADLANRLQFGEAGDY